MHHTRDLRAAALALALAACSSPRTELIVGVATDLHATEQLDGVDLAVTRVDDGAPIVQTHFAISGQPGSLDNLPGSYGIYSDGAETRLDILLTGTKAGAEVVRRHAVINLVEGKTLFYRLGLTTSCMSMADCPDGQTCAEGACVGTRINSAQFPDFDGGLVDTLTCAGGTTYVDTGSGNAPMQMAPEAGACKAGLCHEGTCLDPPPACSVDEAITSCTASTAACNVGCMTTNCTYTFPGGAQGCDQASTVSLTDDCLAAICAETACEQSAQTAWVTRSDGRCGPVGCEFELAMLNASCAPAAQAQARPAAPAGSAAITATGSR